MRRPKGIKTKKSVAKRFKITAGGKVLTRHAGKRHLLSGKSAKRRRALGVMLACAHLPPCRLPLSLQPLLI